MRQHDFCFTDVAAGYPMASTTSGSVKTMPHSVDMTGATAGILNDGWGNRRGWSLGTDGNLYFTCIIAVAIVGGSADLLLQLWEHTAATSMNGGTELARIIIREGIDVAAGNVRSTGLGMWRAAPLARYIGATVTASGDTIDSGTVHLFLGRHDETRHV